MAITEEGVSGLLCDSLYVRSTLTSLEDSTKLDIDYYYLPAKEKEVYKIAKGMADTLTMRYREDPVKGKSKDVIYQSLEEYLNTLKEAGTIEYYRSLRVLRYGHCADIHAVILLGDINFIGFSIQYL